MDARGIVILLVAIVGPFSAQAGVLTGVWSPCAKGDPNINDCVSKSLDKFLPVLKKGLPKYNVPGLDPAVLDAVDYSMKDLKLVTKNAKMSKMFTDFQILKVEADPEKYNFKISLKVPEIVNEGEYELGGKLLMMPVSGSGTYRVAYKDVTLDMIFQGKAKTKDGKPYMELEEVKVMMNPNDVEMSAENLFNGNKELSDNFHKFIMENWRDVWADMRERIWAPLSALFQQSFAKILDEVPYNEIFT